MNKFHVNHDEYPWKFNIVDNKGIVRYHKGDVVMANTGRSEWKYTVMKVNKYDHLHEDYLSEIRY